MENITGIYSIKNKINGKVYIGKSINIYNRWKQHKSQLQKNKHHSKSLQSDWNKYGEDAFEFSIIEECETEQLNKKEYDHIVRYDSFRNGYNEVEGSSGNRAKLSSLSVGDVFTYKELCDYVGEKPQKSEKYLRYQIKDWQRYIGLKIKDGKLYVSEVYDAPLEIKKKLVNADECFGKIIKCANYEYAMTNNGYTTIKDLVDGLHIFNKDVNVNSEIIQLYFSCLTRVMMYSMHKALLNLKHEKYINLKTGLVITYAYEDDDIVVGIDEIPKFYYIVEKSCESFLRRYYPQQLGAGYDYLYILRFKNPNDYELYKNTVICNMQNNKDIIDLINNEVEGYPYIDNVNIILDYNLGYKVEFNKKRTNRKNYDEMICDFKKSIIRYALNSFFQPTFGWCPELKNNKDVINELREFNKEIFDFDDEELDEIFNLDYAS